MNKKYLFYLKDTVGNYYYVNQSTGAVTVTSVKTPLLHYPKGWENLEIKWNRDSKYHGVFRSITTELQFVEDGGKILKFLYANQGVEAKCFCRIERQNDFNLDWELFYEGDIDFAKINIEPFFVNANIIEGGLKALIDSNEDIDYEIKIDPLDAQYKRIYLDGITLQDTLQYVPVKEALQINTSANAPSMLVPTAFVGRDGDYPIGVTRTQNENRIDAGVPIA